MSAARASANEYGTCQTSRRRFRRFPLWRSLEVRPELSRGGFVIPEAGTQATWRSTDALDADELADIFRARLEVHPEVRGFRLERRPRGLAPSPGVHEFHGRGVFELETELVAMERFGDDRPDRGDIPVVRARALDGTVAQGL